MNKNKKNITSILCITMLTVIAINLSACGKTAKDLDVKNNTATSPNNNTVPANTENKNNSSKTPVEIVKGPEFITGKYSEEPKFGTPWVKSPSGKKSASIEGKGEEAKEEGIGKIIIKDAQNNKVFFEIKDKSKQMSPLSVCFFDDENILVTIGLGYGTVTMGGNLYVLNINSGKSAVIDDTKDEKKQIANVRKDGNNLKYDIIVYEDDNLTKYHVENKVITDYNEKINDITSQIK